jgi:hypothetical protein
VIGIEDLQRALEITFLTTNRDATLWPDPYPDRSAVPEEAYSRLTNPAKWRILGNRTEAWSIALAQFELATIEPDANITWLAQPGPGIIRAERVVPIVAGALELVIAHSRIGDVSDAGVVLGVGDPTECINWFPDCGCDACDSGSENELDHLDNHLLGIVTGTFRRLTDGERVITVINHDRWTATNFFDSAGTQVEDALANPHGWTELTGQSWLGTAD